MYDFNIWPLGILSNKTYFFLGIFFSTSLFCSQESKVDFLEYIGIKTDVLTALFDNSPYYNKSYFVEGYDDGHFLRGQYIKLLEPRLLQEIIQRDEENLAQERVELLKSFGKYQAQFHQRQVALPT